MRINCQDIVCKWVLTSTICYAFAWTVFHFAPHCDAGDNGRVEIEPQRPVVFQAEPLELAIPLPPPDSNEATAAMQDFDVVAAEETPEPSAAISPTLAPATRARMFNWNEEDHYRAGCPLQQRHITMTVPNNRYILYKVGGGSPVIGTGPALDEGTWGLDYQGFLPRQVMLNWNRGRREQGGTGAYKTDGPKLHE